MKLIISIIIKAVLGKFLARRDLKKSIRLKAKNDQLEAENEIIDKQNQNHIDTVAKADRLFKRIRKRKKKK